MTITIDLKPEIEMSVTEQAAEEGLPIAEYVESVVKKAVLKRRGVKQLSEKSFDDILKPFRDEVEASGMTDEELEDLFQTARREVAKTRRNL